MNTITLFVRNRPLELVLNERITELTIRTPLSQEMVMGELLSGGYAVGGSMDAVLLRPLALSAGYTLGGTVNGYVMHYLSLEDGYKIGGSASLVLLDYADGFSDGYGMGGECATILTRRRLMSEADTMLISEMDSMIISEIDNITLE